MKFMQHSIQSSINDYTLYAILLMFNQRKNKLALFEGQHNNHCELVHPNTVEYESVPQKQMLVQKKKKEQ